MFHYHINRSTLDIYVPQKPPMRWSNEAQKLYSKFPYCVEHAYQISFGQGVQELERCKHRHIETNQMQNR
ncbi:hypothetical protein WDU94_014286 [Cyamophila willieti]